ncbi:MAG: hypothetical protein K9G26_06340 [Emcibacter sp.]|nr:hypothetical protein [Emcibacter sp.]
MSTPTALSATTVHYFITTDDHPGALPRVLELFALRNITPHKVKVRKYTKSIFQDNSMDIDIHVTGLSPKEQEIIFHKLSSHVSVYEVREEILFQKLSTKLAS